MQHHDPVLKEGRVSKEKEKEGSVGFKKNSKERGRSRVNNRVGCPWEELIELRSLYNVTVPSLRGPFTGVKSSSATCMDTAGIYLLTLTL